MDANQPNSPGHEPISLPEALQLLVQILAGSDGSSLIHISANLLGTSAAADGLLWKMTHE